MVQHHNREQQGAATATPVIGVLTNRDSDRNRRIWPRLCRQIQRNSGVFHFELRRIADVSQALQMFADAQVCALVINGGDGTVQAVLSCLINERPFASPPPLAVLPGGKTNMIAADLGLRGRPDRQLRRLLKRFRHKRKHPKPVERRVIALDLGDGGPPRVGMFFGTAGAVNGLLWCRERVHPMALPSWAAHAIALSLLVLAAIFRPRHSPLASHPIRLRFDGGEELNGRYTIVLATTLAHLLFRLRPFGRTGQGGLKISAVEAGAKPMVRGLLALLTGRFASGRVAGVHTRRTDWLRIEGEDPITLDGEIYRPQPGRAVTLSSAHQLTFLKL